MIDNDNVPSHETASSVGFVNAVVGSRSHVAAIRASFLTDSVGKKRLLTGIS